MSDTLEKRVGRTNHAIFMLTAGGVKPLNVGETPYPKGSDQEAGFIAARLTLFKDLIRIVIRTDTTSPIYPVNKKRFSIHTPHGVIYAPRGIATSIGLSTLPLSTTLNIYNEAGYVETSVTYAGNPKIIG